MTRIPAEHLLKYFVDRLREVSEFDKMMDGTGVRILCIQGPGGMGKSQLLHRMMQECETRGFRWVSIEWEDSRKYDYLEIMCEIRKQIKQDLMFQLFNDFVNSYMVPNYTFKIQLEGNAIENVRVLEGGEIQQSNVTVHIGHTVEIKDLNIRIPRPDRDVTKIEFRLTEAFMVCLEALARQSPLIVFLDAVEKADDLTRKWLCKEFLAQARDRRIDNLFVVAAGRQELELDTTFFDCRASFSLRPFEPDHIREYLSRRGVDPAEQIIYLILSQSENGNPGKVGNLVDGYLNYMRHREAHV